ncbi:uncharacterized protein LOC133197541 isoform X2 [Saccostrea echinata]|uniref:uncharacterized protein LOC133197541 isoform X2 n=1 Tax=Saccostrea echinata TaxID=191078 RepID=UPI002A83234D|nr:uncharacterized protein LOC133197541 isoform X2 [Saccostrea echinata]
MRSELKCIFPSYLQMLEERICDLDREDNGIVVAGETSSGKSTLINSLIGETILKTRTTENTSTICRIWNSANIGLKVYNDNNDCIYSKMDYTREQLSKLRQDVKRYTDVESMSDNCSFVDILYPVPILKGKTILVDTPGVGGTRRLEELMLRYLQNAVAFVFLVNASNAGGLQDDKLPRILKDLTLYHNDNKMPCFDPSDVIFCTNKWDAVEQCCDDDSDEDDVTMTWNKVKESIKRHWGSVKDDQIFQISLKKMKETGESKYKSEYGRFKDKLQEIIDRNYICRKQKHIRFLTRILRVIERGICGRLQASESSEDEFKTKVDKLYSTVVDLVNKKKQLEKELHVKINSTISKLCADLMEYVRSKEGREEILNPPHKKDIKEISVFVLQRKVKDRYCAFLGNWRQGPKVISAFGDLEREIKEAFTSLRGKIKQVENDLMEEENSSLFPDLVQTTVWFKVDGIAGILSAIAGIVLPSLFSADFRALKSDEKKMVIIEKSYEECTKIYDEETTKNDLNVIYGNHYRDVIDTMLNMTIGNDIKSLYYTFERLHMDEKRFEYKAKYERYKVFHEALKDLKHKIEEADDNLVQDSNNSSSTE